jgi:hypothetical protein
VTRAETVWLKIIGVLLILLGLTLIASPRVTYTTKERVAHTQSTDIITKRQKKVVVPRPISALIVAGGVIALIFASKQSK